MLKKQQIKFFAGLWGVMLLTSCAYHVPSCFKDGKSYCHTGGTFTHQWYDYYERAVSCMEGGCYQDALDDLDKAISQRADDKRMAKTYGMHLSDYFPHREKGLIYYLSGNNELAETELERSLSYEKSAKALFYLDKVRKRLLEKDVVSTPGIFIKNISDNELWTCETPVMISGNAEDPQYISEITVGNQPVFLEGSGKKIDFEEALVLNEGSHDVDITAKNLMNGSYTRRIHIHVDRTGPVIALERVQTDELKGYVYDESGEIFLSANGQACDIPKGKKASFSILLAPNTARVTLTAKDKLGNETQAVIELSNLSAQHRSFLFAGLASDTPAYKPPVIMIDESAQTVFSETISIKGQIKSTANIESLFINEMKLYETGGRFVFFNHPVPLNPGENQIVIRARDSVGKEAVKSLAVIREIPEPFKPQYRCKFKPEPFKLYVHSNQTGDSSAEKLQDLLSKGLIAKKRFQIAADLSDTASRFLLSGYIHNTNAGLEMISKITDILTGELIDILDAYGETGRAAESTAADLAEKFHKRFPLVKGRIIKKYGDKFFVVADGDIRMIWPLVVGSDTRFSADAQIDEKMTKGHYRIKLINGRESAIGDWVITQ